MKISNFPELRILAILGIITLGWHLFGVFGSFISLFADIFLLLILSWILSFVLEPLVESLSKKGLSRMMSAVIIYLAVALCAIVLIWVVLPTTLTQLTQLAGNLPIFLPEKIVQFLTGTIGNYVSFASGVASTLTGLLLVFIFSFYFLLSRKEISRFVLEILPEEYEEDYLFLEKVLNNTFASFLQIQIVLGLVMGAITFITLTVLGINLAVSTSIVAAILAMIPVVGPVLMIFPVVLATLSISMQKMLIATSVIILTGQLVYNILSPKLLGTALKIHPIIVLLSFLVGYRLGGVWGAIFAVPVTSAIFIIVKEILKYWKQEADK